MGDSIHALDVANGETTRLAGPAFDGSYITVRDGASDRRGRFVFGGCSLGPWKTRSRWAGCIRSTRAAGAPSSTTAFTSPTVTAFHPVDARCIARTASSPRCTPTITTSKRDG